MLIATALLSCSCLILPDNIVTAIVMRNTMCCSTILLFAFLLLSSVSNRLVAKLEWLRKANAYSLEIYLYQFVFLQLLDEVFRLQKRMIDMSYVIGVMMLTIVIAYFMQPIDKKLLESITKITNKNYNKKMIKKD